VTYYIFATILFTFCRFVESDIFMLFRGGGPGHQELYEYLRPFAIDAGVDKVQLPAYDSDGEVIEGEQLDTVLDEDSEDIDNAEQSCEVLDSDEEAEEEEEDALSDNEWFEDLGPEDGDDMYQYSLDDM
jgi:hypothetical protein